MIVFLNALYEAIDEGKTCAAVFLDLKKAFDTVDHKILLQKLHHLGMSMSSISWFENYLLDRTQVTKVENTMSEIMPLTCGVPQGSILGPLMFLIYVNDLHK